MIERFSSYDKVLLGGALVMAAGTVFPVVKMPIVGSINYIAGGQGNGVVIVIIAGAIVLAGLNEYRRVAALLGLISLCIMAHTLVSFFIFLAKERAHPLPKDNPFNGLDQLITSSIGIEWGWVPLIGGALAVVIAGFMSSSSATFNLIGILAETALSESISTEKADATIAIYLASQSRSPANTKQSGAPTFGKRTV